MPVNIKVKLLQYFLSENQDKGFTRIGWLVRILLYSSVATVLALPFYTPDCSSCHNLLNSANKARESEGKMYIGSMNRAQQAYYLEKGTFTKSIADLGLGIKTETNYYSHRILSPMIPVQTLNKSVNKNPSVQTSVTIISQSKKPVLRSFIGSVFVIPSKDIKEKDTIAVICEVQKNNPLPTNMPSLVNREIQCPKGSEALR